MSQINKINERVSCVESQCTEIVLLKGEIKSLKAQRLSPIPQRYTLCKNEKLDAVFESVCTALNIPTPAYKSIFRHQNRYIRLVKSPKKNRLTSAFTLSGVVYIKVNPGVKPRICIEDLKELRKFFQNPLKTLLPIIQTELPSLPYYFKFYDYLSFSLILTYFLIFFNSVIFFFCI